MGEHSRPRRPTNPASRKLVEKRTRREERTARKKRGRDWTPIVWGFHARPYPPEDWVHNLEHGGIAILYECPQPQAAGGAQFVDTDLSCPDEQSPVQNFMSSAPREALFQEVKIVATPYPVPNHRFALVAWGWRLFMDTWDPALAERFYEAHVDNGPERIP